MYVRPLKETTIHLSMFPNKDTPCGRENESTQERSRDVLDVADKKETAFSFVLYKISDILLGRQMLQQYQTIGEIFFRFCAKLCWKKPWVSLCSANAWIGCSKFSVRVCNTSDVHTGQTFAINCLKIQLSWILMLYYPYREYWCYIIRIKRCCPCTNRWLFLHVLAICL